MTAVCNGVDLSSYIAHGYVYEREPQYGGQITALDGTDYSAKIRDRVRLTVPFQPLPLATLEAVLQLFPDAGAYVTWTFYDPFTGGNRTAVMKYETRSTTLRVRYHNGTELWDGLVVKLIER